MTYTEASPLQFEDQALYLIEGTLSELQIARTTINLMSKSTAASKPGVLLRGLLRSWVVCTAWWPTHGARTPDPDLDMIPRIAIAL